MTGLLFLTVACFVWVTVYFALIQKTLFVLMDHQCVSRPITMCDVRDVYAHGIVSDFIIAAYLTAIPVLAATVRTEWTAMPLAGVMTVYNSVTALIVGLITVADAVLYRYWQYKLDTSAFIYLKSPKGAFASVSGLYLVGAAVMILLFSWLYFVGAQWAVEVSLPLFGTEAAVLGVRVGAPVVAMCIIAGLFLITRGLKIRPNNPSVVYYSNIPFFNHWALNPAYNLLYSLTVREDDFEGRFRYFEPAEAERITRPLFPVSGTPEVKLLRTDRPNILLIIWESLGAEFVESLGGRDSVTPNLDRLGAEGVMFTECTAGSFRTDRGLVCVLSGYPGQPTTSVIRHTRKLPNLPALPRRLRDDCGYVTTAVHGGELTIMHKADYYLASGHDTLVSQKDLPSDAPAGKWGIEDGWMFDWLYDDIMARTKRGERWMTTFQTLSSHEPFKVPYNRLENEVDNSFAYVDDALGRFVGRLKTTPAWRDLLIVVVADHGYNAPTLPVDRRSYAHIPVVFAGGAVEGGRRIDTIMSQTDLPALILGQMGLDHSDFPFSRDILAPTYTHSFAFHTYNNGFMYIDPRGCTIVDNVSDQAVEGPDPERERRGRALLQTLYTDLSRR